jgi:hypothetical protein
MSASHGQAEHRMDKPTRLRLGPVVSGLTGGRLGDDWGMTGGLGHSPPRPARNPSSPAPQAAQPPATREHRAGKSPSGRASDPRYRQIPPRHSATCGADLLLRTAWRAGLPRVAGAPTQRAQEHRANRPPPCHPPIFAAPSPELPQITYAREIETTGDHQASEGKSPDPPVVSSRPTAWRPGGSWPSTRGAPPLSLGAGDPHLADTLPTPLSQCSASAPRCRRPTPAARRLRGLVRWVQYTKM